MADEKKIKPTDEQVAIIDAAIKGDSFKVGAVAGSGKTSTQVLVADAISQRPGSSKKILYMGFNRALVEESRRKFKGSVECRTAHSLAFGSATPDMKARIGSAAEIWQSYQQFIESDPSRREKFESAVGCVRAVMDSVFSGESDRALSRIVMTALRETVSGFEHSSDSTISYDHFARKNWRLLSQLKSHIREGAMRKTIDPESFLREKLGSRVFALAEEIWRNSVMPGSPLKITHDTYLKCFQLKELTLPYDVILVDEAQDLDPVMLAIVEKQTAQKIFVGDEHQQIYSWRGAVNAMALPGLPLLSLTQSFRFGPEAAAFANRILGIKPLVSNVSIPVVRGTPGIDTRIVTGMQDLDQGFHPTMIISRTNAGVLKNAITEIEHGGRPYIAGGAASFTVYLEEAWKIKTGQPSSHPEFLLFGNSFDELKKFAEGPDGGGYSVIVSLVEKYKDKIPSIAENIRQGTSKSPAEGSVVLTTAHRSKGLESPHVLIDDDFIPFVSENEEGECRYNEEGCNLSYVTATRVQRMGDYREFEKTIAVSLACALKMRDGVTEEESIGPLSR